jgi:radical SAM superfamily enzyme YgiQ (UPF0313 family)
MGGGCYLNEKRDLLVVGNYCENNCFPKHGGCASAQDDEIKDVLMCELRPDFDEPLISRPLETIIKRKEKCFKEGKSLFLYTPDMFNEFYFEHILSKLPNDQSVYLCINACVNSFLKRANWQDLYSVGIREIWFGVESGSRQLRDLYNKPKFSNQDIIEITEKGRDLGINCCWFLVDGVEDTNDTRLETYNLLKKAQPFKFHFSPLNTY